MVSLHKNIISNGGCVVPLRKEPKQCRQYKEASTQMSSQLDPTLIETYLGNRSIKLDKKEGANF